MDEKFPYGFLAGLVAASAITFIAWPIASNANKRYHIEIVDTNPTSLSSAFLKTNAGPLFAVQTNGEDVAKALLAAIKAHGAPWYTNVALTKEQLQEEDVQRTLAALNRIITADATNYVLSGPDGTPFMNSVHDPLRPDQIDKTNSVVNKHPEWIGDSHNSITEYDGPVLTNHFTNVIISGPAATNHFTNLTISWMSDRYTNDYIMPKSNSSYLIPGSDHDRPVWMPFPKFKVKESPGLTMNTFEFIFESEIEPVVTRITNVYGDLRWEVRIK